ELESLRVAHLGVAELERITGLEAGIAFLERTFVHQELEPGPRRNAEVMPAVRAGPQVFLEHGLEQRLAALVALGPQPFGQIGARRLLGRLDAGAFAFQPGHESCGLRDRFNTASRRATASPAHPRRCHDNARVAGPPVEIRTRDTAP